MIRRGGVSLALWLAGLPLLLGSGQPVTAQVRSGRQRTVLDNGLVLLFRPNPAALTLAVCCFVKASAMVEMNAGLRNLSQQTLLDNPGAGGQSLATRVAQLGMQMRVQTTPDYMETMFLGTGDQLGQALHFVHETLTARQVPAAALKFRKDEVLRDVMGRRTQPLLEALDLATAHLYRDTPCAWPVCGNMSLSGITAQQILALRETRCVPNNCVVAVAGNVSWEACQREVRHYLGGLLPRPVPAEPKLKLQEDGHHAYLYHRAGGDSAVVMMAAPCPGPETNAFPAAAVLNAVLGAGEGARLFKALRRKRGDTYTISTDLTPSRLCGMLGVEVTCEPKAAPQVFHIMQDQVDGLKSRPPTDAEIERAQAYLTSSYVLGYQRNADVAHYLGLFEVLSPERGESDLASLIAAVTPEQVTRATGWLLDKVIWVQVGGPQPG